MVFLFWILFLFKPLFYLDEWITALWNEFYNFNRTLIRTQNRRLFFFLLMIFNVEGEYESGEQHNV